MEKLKLMTLIGTRPELIKLSEIIKKADIFFNHIVVHTGQNYSHSLNSIFFDDLQLRQPNYYLNVNSDNLGTTIGNIIAKSYEIMTIERPDAILILGDTNSALSAICAKRLKIPIFHMEAGNRCYDENLPEEINRKIVDHISDINLPYSEHARRYLFSEGIKKEFVFVIGSPMREVLETQKNKINASKILTILDLKSKNYLLLSAHREENIDIEDNFYELMNSINEMAKYYNLPIIYSVHPRSMSYIIKRNFKFHQLVRMLDPFCFSDYIALQKNAKCVISDSGTLAEESSILKFPAVSIRTSTERPEAIDKGHFIIGSISSKSILQATELAISSSAINDLSEVSDYQDLHTSLKVVKIIQSYVDIINRNVWKK